MQSDFFYFKKKILDNIEKQLEFVCLRDHLSCLFQFHAVIFFIIGFFPFFTKKKKVEARYIAKPL